jgi:hypothetical protein
MPQELNEGEVHEDASEETSEEISEEIDMEIIEPSSEGENDPAHLGLGDSGVSASRCYPPLKTHPLDNNPQLPARFTCRW